MSEYELPDLPYGYRDLEPLYSAEMLKLHHGKHHAGYVEGANKTLEALCKARDSENFLQLNQLQKDLAFNISGHSLHSIFWLNMSPNGGGEPSGALKKQIDKDFGSINALRNQMSAAAAQLQGSGWVSLAWEPLGCRFITEQVFDHQGNTGSATQPLLVIDCWEHAYYLQYQNNKAKWVEKFWELVNWDDVESRHESLAGI